MNINNITTVTAPVETVQVETPMPVSEPNKIDAAEKIQNQLLLEKQQAALLKTREKEENKLSAEETRQLAAEMNEIMDDLQTNLGFSIRDDLNHLVIVEIKNRETNELIKQIPSEELVAIKEKMEELTGLLLDHSV